MLPGQWVSDLSGTDLQAGVTARILHDPTNADRQAVLATDVKFADSVFSKSKGLMFRKSVPDDFALVMEMGTNLLGRPSRQAVHMLFVRFPIDVIWLVDDEVTHVKSLHPWRGTGVARADRIIELPAGVADAVHVGDTVRVDRE